MIESQVGLTVRAGSSRRVWLLPVAVGVVVAVAWLLNTPEGVLGKADAVGYAICHRIDTHSLFLGDRQLPLCARCTGMYLGALISLVTLLGLGRLRSGSMPPLRLMLVLFGFVGVMGVDGVNSYLNLLGLPNLYPPQNTLRVITGLLTGLTLGVLIFPVLSQTLWRNWEERPALGRWREIGLLVLIAAGVAGLVLSDVDVVLYPLALLSALGVVAMLTAINTTILLLVLRRANQALTWRDAAWPLLAGLALAMVQIAAVNAARYGVFGTWGGLPVPG